MANTVYDLGDIAVLSVTFTVAAAPTDPTTVAATVRKPDGTTTVYTTEIVHDGTGRYHLNVVCDQAGEWTWKFVGTGTAADVDTGGFYVKPDPTASIGRNLCTIDDVTSYVPGYRQDDATDAKLLQLIGSESSLVLSETNREIVARGTQPSTRIFDIEWLELETREVMIGDLATTDGLVVDLHSWDGTFVQTVDPAAIVALPRDGEREEWEPYGSLHFPPWFLNTPLLAHGYTFHITGAFGFPTIPTFVREAVAKRVILRYISDVATKGTSFAESIDDVNAAALFASARDAIARVRIPSVA
jgi:hypothetical protein